MGIAEQLMSATSPTAHLPTCLSTGFFLWDLLHLALWERYDAMMVAHHVVSIFVWPVTLFIDAIQFPVMIFMASEVSSPFLQLRWMIRTACGKGSAFRAVNMMF